MCASLSLSLSLSLFLFLFLSLLSLLSSLSLCVLSAHPNLISRSQVSRYEAAFKKMARAAGSNDAEVVIAKFVGRNETRAGLLEERAQVSKRKADLDADQTRLTARLSEMQYSMVHPAMTETALRRLDPKLTRASGRLALLQDRLAILKSLQLNAGNGCAALLARVAAALPSLGPPPEDDLTVDEKAGGSGGGGGAKPHRDSTQKFDADEGGGGAKGGGGGGDEAGEGVDMALDEKVLALFRTCEARLEKLAGMVQTSSDLDERLTASNLPLGSGRMTRRASDCHSLVDSSESPRLLARRASTDSTAAGVMLRRSERPANSRPMSATSSRASHDDPLLDAATALNIRVALPESDDVAAAASGSELRGAYASMLPRGSSRSVADGALEDNDANEVRALTSTHARHRVASLLSACLDRHNMRTSVHGCARCWRRSKASLASSAARRRWARCVVGQHQRVQRGRTLPRCVRRRRPRHHPWRRD